MTVLNVNKIGTYGIAVERCSIDTVPPAGHHLESIRAGEYWLVRDASPAAVMGSKKSPRKTKAARTNGAKGGRPKTRAAERLEALKAAPPEQRAQAFDSWLEAATTAQVRRHWRSWMGRKPGWSESP